MIQETREIRTFPSIDGIPYGAENHEADENYDGVVHADRRDWQRRGHGEQDELEEDPSDGHHVDEGADRRTHGPARGVDFAAAVEQRDGDRDAVGHRQGYDADGDEGEESGGRAEVNQAQQHLHDRREGERPDGRPVPLVQLRP